MKDPGEIHHYTLQMKEAGKAFEKSIVTVEVWWSKQTGSAPRCQRGGSILVSKRVVDEDFQAIRLPCPRAAP